MSNPDEVDFQRIGNIIKGMGWSIKKMEVTDTKLHIEIEKERIEPGEDICCIPT